MTDKEALDRVIEKLQDRHARNEDKVEDAFDRGLVAGTRLALEDALMLRSIVEGTTTSAATEPVAAGAH